MHGVPVFAVLNHDDDVLLYWVYAGGDKVDSFNSDPDFFDGEMGPERGGNAALLAKSFGRADAVRKVSTILDMKFDFVVELHAALVEVLGLPMSAVGMGFKYIDRGDVPEGVIEETLLRTAK